MLVLGIYHFANPGRDVVKVEVPEVLSEDKQSEIAEVVEALAGFDPTKIAVEVHPYDAGEMDTSYATYLGGRRELGREEHEQLGFRLAERFGHPRLHPINAWDDFPYHEVMEYGREREPGFVECLERSNADREAEMNGWQREKTVAEILRLMNEPDRLAEDHAWYMAFARLGYVGATLISKWYARNIRIFANLKGLVEAGDRILVIFGAGHVPILRHLVDSDPDLDLVDTFRYLPTTR